MKSSSSFNVVGLCGSIRKNAYNRLALNAASGLMPDGVSLTILDISTFPLFDADVMAAGVPEGVQKVVDAVRAADAVLIASPEYNFSVSGVLKNAIDWISRAEDQPFSRKPTAILSATQGPLGGARSQYDLRKILGFLDAAVLNKPEVFIGMAPTKFDTNGLLIDQSTTDILARQMSALLQLVRYTHRALEAA